MGTPRPLASNSAGQPLLQAGTSPQFLTNVTPFVTPVAPPLEGGPFPQQPVVLGFALNDPSIIVNRTALNLPVSAVPASLKVWNFSDRPRTVSLVNQSVGVQIGTLPAKLTLQPKQVQTVALSVQRSAAAIAAPMLKIGGESENVPVGALVVPSRPSLDAFNRTRIVISNTGLWRKNSAGTMTLIGDAAANSMRFNVQFRPNTDWYVYPALNVKAAGMKLAGSSGVTFEIKAEGTSVKLQRANAIVKTTNQWGSKSYQLPIFIGTTWQTATVLWDFDAPEDFKKENTVEIQIGANSQQAQLSYTVRGLQVLTPK